MGMEFGSAIVGAVAQYVIQPIVKQFGYLFCYKRNMENMTSQMRRLNRMSKGVRQSVDASRRNLREIAPDVDAWLINVDKVRAEMDSISQPSSNNTGCCGSQYLNLKSRYVLSRRAKKKTGVAIQLIAEGESYVCLSNPTLLVGMDVFASGSTYINFNSRKSTEEKIEAALRDTSVNIIGVCGMGGVGKTTMVTKIAERARKEKVFDEVVMAVVGQQTDLRKIQGEIAELLDMKLEEESLLARASRLRSRLRNVSRVLVILDDVWARLDLEELGIPSTSHRGCKVMLTSRIRDVCVATEAERVLTVEVLSGEEGWILFTKLAGKSIEALHLCPIAKDVVDECKGLPIALVTVGRALRNKLRPVWEDALLQLRKALPRNIPGVLADVYRPLELSYTRLESDEARSLFLLCCLFQEDFNIPVEDLTRYGMGLRMFLGIENLEEARNRANTLVEILKDRFLLFQGYRSSHVKMHDLIRDVAIFIASQDNQSFMISHNVNLKEWPTEYSTQPYTCISFISKAITALPGQLDCPKLELLQLECNKQPLEAPDSFFDGMTTLKVLDMCAMNLLSLPSSLGFLTNLRVLHLYGCSLENIFILGKLTNLEVLSFRGSQIKVLPAELRKLTKLRLLDMTGCDDLETIAANVISSLTRLEELCMGRNFNFKWAIEGEGEGRSIAALSELEALTSLTTLEIVVPDSNAIPRNMRLSSKLTKYAISIRDVLPNSVGNRFQRAMYLFLPNMTPLAYWITVALRGSEYLNLIGEGSMNAVSALEPKGFEHVKVLKINNCDVLEYLAKTVDWFIPGTTIFPALESLDLCNLASLREVCHGQLPLGSFSSLKELKLDLLDSLENLFGPTEVASLANLRSICISRCRRLQYLFPLSTVIGLSKLKEVKISDCEIMQEVFPGDGVDIDLVAPFNNMHICLVNLPNLTKICEGIPYDRHLYAFQGPQIVEEQDPPVTSFRR